MKQRIITLLLAAMLCLSLAACGDETGELDNGAENNGALVSNTASGGQGEASSDTIEVDGMTLGTGLELGEAVAQLDEHPDRAVRRSTRPIVQTVGTMLDGSSLSNEFYLYRSMLNDHGKQAYDQIRAGLLEGKATIQMTVPVSTDEIFPLFSMVVYDNPELFWVRTSMSYSYNNYGNVTSVTPDYYDLVHNIPGYTGQLESAVSDALADMWSLTSDAERVKYAHDYLTYTIDYVAGSSYNQSAYSALTLGQSVCAGYARAFQYMMQKMGIPCAYVVGYAGENHAWNLVQLSGEYYAMDVTWDDPLGNPSNQYYYNYFNLTDNQMSADHTRKDSSVNLPWASGTTYSFHNAFGSYGTDFNAIQGNLPDGESGEGQPANGGSDNPYLPSGNGDNPYLPSDGGGAWGDAWDDVNWDDWNYDDYEELGYDWWNALDESWTLEDWTDYGDGTWEIWDEETQCYYFYDEFDGTFGCMDATDETFYLLNFETGEWIPLNGEGGEGGEGQPVNGGSDNPYLPSGSGDNPYLPSDGGDASEDGVNWDDWNYDDYEELGYDWWNALDESWTLEDWTDYGDGTWEIWDEETQCYYFYDESDGTFGCMDAADETFYLLDFETGEWLPLN